MDRREIIRASFEHIPSQLHQTSSASTKKTQKRNGKSPTNVKTSLDRRHAESTNEQQALENHRI